MPDIEEFPRSHEHLLQKPGDMVPTLPELSPEIMKRSFPDVHAVISQKLEVQVGKSRERESQIRQLAILAYGPLLLTPDYLKKGENAKTEDVIKAIGIRETLARAIYVGGAADADPKFSRVLVSMLTFVESFAEGHKDDDYGRGLRRWVNGLKAEIGVDKALSGEYRVFSPSVEESAENAYKLDAQNKIDRVLIHKTSKNTVFWPDIQGSFFMDNPPFSVDVNPNPVPFYRPVRKAMKLPEGRLVNSALKNGGKILRLNLGVSTNPKYMSGLDLSLGSSGAILRAYARLDEGVRDGIIRDMGKWLS